MVGRRRKLGLALVALACSWSAMAQDGSTLPGDESVFAPYPSRMRVGLKDDGVLITWEDSPDVRGGYLIFRHLQEPNAANFADAVLIGDAPDGQGYFEYLPPDDRPYYYIVLGRAEGEAGQGSAYEVFIPLRNASLVPLAFAAASGSAAATETAAAPAETQASPGGPDQAASAEAAVAAVATSPQPGQKTAVDRLLARTEGEAIVVSFEAKSEAGRIVLYRATEAVIGTESLLGATVAAILEPGSGPYRDYPVPGIGYYYAAVPERELMGGTVLVSPGANATTVSAVVAAGSYRVGLPSSSPQSRAMPLPFLVLQKGLSDARPVIADDLSPQSRSLSPEAEKAADALLARYGTASAVSRPDLTLFPEDLASPGGGEEYALRLVVRNSLSKGQYEQAARELALYLSLPRSPANAAKARFYRAQALAMGGGYQEAFFELLRAQDLYFVECVPWMDYILGMLRSD